MQVSSMELSCKNSGCKRDKSTGGFAASAMEKKYRDPKGGGGGVPGSL
jgi:hypothetical protein